MKHIMDRTKRGLKWFLPIALLVPSLGLASTDKLVAECAQVEGDLARLTCYDNLAKSKGLEGPQANPVNVSGVGKWDVSSTSNPIDDSKTVVLMLAADSGKTKWGKSIYMTIRCQSNETDLYIAWGDYLGSSASVLTRIGSSAAVTKKWLLSTDKQAAFHPSGAISFIKSMMESNKFVAQVTPYNESPSTAVFNTAGLKNAIKPLRETCSW